MDTARSHQIEQLIAEGPLGMAAAARLLGTFRQDKGCHPSTLTRWCLKGVPLPSGQMLRLEHFRTAGRLMTSRAAVVRFLAAQQAPEPTGPDSPRAPQEVRRAADAAAAALERMGA